MSIEDKISKYLKEAKSINDNNHIKGYKEQKNLKCCLTCDFVYENDSFDYDFYECDNPKHDDSTQEEGLEFQTVSPIGLCPLYKRK